MKKKFQYYFFNTQITRTVCIYFFFNFNKIKFETNNLNGVLIRCK